jgi:hypothetical protein
MVYASEADVLNVALFGITAKQWRDENPDLKGNIRDYANINELYAYEKVNVHPIPFGCPSHGQKPHPRKSVHFANPSYVPLTIREYLLTDPSHKKITFE